MAVYGVPTSPHSIGKESKGTMNCGGTIRLNPVGLAIIGALLLLSLIFLVQVSRRNNETELINSSEKISLKELLAVAIHAAQNGGKEVKSIREAAALNEESKGKTKEGAKELVTDGDMKSHIQMYNGIKNAFYVPLNIVSEEKNRPDLDLSNVLPADKHEAEVQVSITEDEEVPVDDITVWIDPLDATQEYTENLLQYVTTMVCVAVKGKPVMGVIHKPFEDYTAWGWVGKGVSKSVTAAEKANDADKTTVIVSRSHAGKVKEVVDNVFGDKGEVVPAGGAGYKTLEVIKGNADAYVHVTLIKKWDICAGNAILNALHGQLTTLNGEGVNYSGYLPPANEKGLLATLYKHEDFLQKFKDTSL